MSVLVLGAVPAEVTTGRFYPGIGMSRLFFRVSRLMT
jgi:hypothetical protein